MNASEEAPIRTEGPMETSGASSIPASSLGRLSTSTLSMRNKKKRKKHASAHHNSNFHAGYVPVTEDVLHRSGIRGRKRYFLYCTLTVLLVVALLNTLVTGWLLYMLGITHMGLAHIEMINLANRSFLHVFGPAFASSISLSGVPLGSKQDDNISFTSQNSSLYMNSFKSSNLSPNIILSENNIIVNADSMKIKSNQSKKWLALDLETIASTHGISNFFVDGLSTLKVKNPKNVKDLYFESSLKKVKVNGSEGVDFRSMESIEVTGRGDIVVQSDGSVIFQSKYSIYLNHDLPKVETSRSISGPQPSKVCMCGNGKLFFVAASTNPSSCNIGRRKARTVCKR